MSYSIRILAPVESAPAASEIRAALRHEGFDVSLEPSPSDADWGEIRLSTQGQTILLARGLRAGEDNPVDDEIDVFLDLLLEQEDTPGVQQVEDMLRRARQEFYLEIPDEFPWGAGRNVVDALVEFVADRTEGLIQADGEGFYDRMGNLLVAME